jgi:hypothetical protein
MKTTLSIFPIRLNWFYRLDLKGDDVVLMVRHLLYWWKWSVGNWRVCKASDPIKFLTTI